MVVTFSLMTSTHPVRGAADVEDDLPATAVKLVHHAYDLANAWAADRWSE